MNHEGIPETYDRMTASVDIDPLLEAASDLEFVIDEMEPRNHKAEALQKNMKEVMEQLRNNIEGVAKAVDDMMPYIEEIRDAQNDALRRADMQRKGFAVPNVINY